MPTGFLPIDPKLPTCQRRDDMGRKADMTWLLTNHQQLANNNSPLFCTFAPAIETLFSKILI